MFQVGAASQQARTLSLVLMFGRFALEGKLHPNKDGESYNTIGSNFDKA